MPNGKDAQMPRMPNGSQELAPKAPALTGMSLSVSTWKSVSAAIAKTTTAATAMAVTIRLKRSASPTPHRWIPMKIAKQAR